jgi:hypothetical protein
MDPSGYLKLVSGKHRALHSYILKTHGKKFICLGGAPLPFHLRLCFLRLIKVKKGLGTCCPQDKFNETTVLEVDDAEFFPTIFFWWGQVVGLELRASFLLGSFSSYIFLSHGSLWLWSYCNGKIVNSMSWSHPQRPSSLTVPFDK